ncbi:hypothetical protein SSAG_02536 [Streptomyces sp. Mg1]|nr:hypothetical protein SSAG_02536 [Streptomyces sp. Mg1]
MRFYIFLLFFLTDARFVLLAFWLAIAKRPVLVSFSLPIFSAAELDSNDTEISFSYFSSFFASVSSIGRG